MSVRLRILLVCSAAICLATACMNDIWNAGDLAEWVRDGAVEQGCDRETIELEDWYRSEDDGNNWHGECLKQDDSEPMNFSINVDSVWTPSSSG